jgi:hypothetical protein
MKRLQTGLILAGLVAMLMAVTWAAPTDQAIPRRTTVTCPDTAPYVYYNTSDLLWHCTDTPVLASNAAFPAYGTTTTPLTTSTANKNFLGFWVQSTATTGDARGMYLRLYLSGGGSGEAGRFYTTINNGTVAVGGTVNGAHISLNATGASAAVSGSANAVRATLDLASTVGAIGGTLAVIRADTNIATGPTVPATTAFMAFDNAGTQKLGYLFNITNPDTSAMFVNAGTGAQSCGVSTGAVANKVLKITVGGVNYWLPLCSSNS